MIYEFTMADEVVRGGVLIEKRDLESGLLDSPGRGQPGWDPV